MNFYKSKVFGIGVDPEYVVNMVGILHCQAGSISLKYFGLPVGANMALV